MGVPSSCTTSAPVKGLPAAAARVWLRSRIRRSCTHRHPSEPGRHIRPTACPGAPRQRTPEMSGGVRRTLRYLVHAASARAPQHRVIFPCWALRRSPWQMAATGHCRRLDAWLPLTRGVQAGRISLTPPVRSHSALSLDGLVCGRLCELCLCLAFVFLFFCFVVIDLLAPFRLAWKDAERLPFGFSSHVPQRPCRVPLQALYSSPHSNHLGSTPTCCCSIFDIRPPLRFPARRTASKTCPVSLYDTVISHPLQTAFL